MSEIIEVKVRARAKINKVDKIKDKNYKIYTTVPPTDGKANKSIIKMLSKYFKINKSRIEIIKGEKDNKKIIKID